MSPEDLIRAGGATLAFDTNAILGFTREERKVVFGRFLDFCDDANRLKDQGLPSLDVTIVVPALVRMEALHDLRTQRGVRPFDRDIVRNALVGRANVVAFDEDAAIDASGSLHRWFTSDDDWQKAKRARCLEALHFHETDPPGAGGLASIDWAIAAQAEAKGWILVTADTRAEFNHVSRKLKKQNLREILDRILHEHGLAPRNRISATGPTFSP